MDERAVTEAELHAWLDGELPAERCAAVRRHLADHAEDARRLESYRRQGALIARAFAQLDNVPHVPSRRERRPLLAAAAVLLVLAGAAGGWFGHQLLREQSPDLASYALSAHGVYAAEARHPVEVTADQSDHLVAWLSKRLDRPLRIPSLSSAGYQLIGGRLLPTEYGPAAQLMYESPERNRLTIYVCPVRPGAETAFRVTRSGPLTALLWRDAGLGWALVAELDRDRLVALAHQVQAELGR